MLIYLIKLYFIYAKLNLNEKLHSGNIPLRKFPRQTFRKISTLTISIDFKYLGSYVNAKGGCEEDVKHRITVA